MAQKSDRDRIIRKLGAGGSINPRTDDGDVIRQMIRDGYLTPPASGMLGSGQDAGSIKLTKVGRDRYTELTGSKRTNECHMKITLSELKRIIASEVALASGNIRGTAGRSLYDEGERCDEDDMYEADEQKPKSSKKRPTPRMPKRGRHDVSRVQKRKTNESMRRRARLMLRESADEFTENERRLMNIIDNEPDVQRRLEKLLDEYDWAKSHEGHGDSRFDGEYERDNEDGQWSTFPYADAVSNEITNVIDEMLSAGFNKQEIKHFDPRMKNHIWW